MSEETFKASEILKVLFSQFDSSSLKEASEILTAWKGIIFNTYNYDSTISNYNKYDNSKYDRNKTAIKLAEHSRVIDLKNNILHIEADHPGWIQVLTMQQSKLLREIKRKFPDLQIKGLSFRLSK